MVVVDASVALKWFVQEEGTPSALSMLASADSLIAPELVIAEMCNGAWRMSQTGRMTKEQAMIVAAQAEAADLADAPPAPSDARTAKLALKHGRKTQASPRLAASMVVIPASPALPSG
ncbi:MAG: type II toxin-antitoxin system VapC family toxin [Rhodospirillales bacterium]|nr:type II toxin-antitoxin system VapC family toxin [Rhodospirillales bacterium]